MSQLDLTQLNEIQLNELCLNIQTERRKRSKTTDVKKNDAVMTQYMKFVNRVKEGKTLTLPKLLENEDRDACIVGAGKYTEPIQLSYETSGGSAVVLNATKIKDVVNNAQAYCNENNTALDVYHKATITVVFKQEFLPNN
mgnify:CR=1 FL=1